ncbi:MAG: glycosyltransferase family 2 protein, partial [Cytophagales bacterium]
MIPPKVSVIMACYNVSRFVDYALIGIRNQIYKNFEVIAVDDGSTDDTLNRLAQAEGEFDLKIIRCERNRGLPAALNIGMSNASGDFIARFDPDDFMNDWRIRDQVYYLLENPEIDLVGGGAEVFGITKLTITPRTLHAEIKDEFL